MLIGDLNDVLRRICNCTHQLNSTHGRMVQFEFEANSKRRVIFSNDFELTIDAVISLLGPPRGGLVLVSSVDNKKPWVGEW